MRFVSAKVDPSDFFLEPIQYVFEDGDQEFVVTFVPTVPHGAEAARIFGDLFECRLREITFESVPVAVGSDAELRIILSLEQFADDYKTKGEQNTLRHGKFPKMDGDMVFWTQFLWFIDALKSRRNRNNE